MSFRRHYVIAATAFSLLSDFLRRQPDCLIIVSDAVISASSDCAVPVGKVDFALLFAIRFFDISIFIVVITIFAIFRRRHALLFCYCHNNVIHITTLFAIVVDYFTAEATPFRRCFFRLLMLIA